ncbi:MAG: transporter substrate-binding domain-containing protein [Treponemataceae bacterium]|nr:transporter substrate-binding domain-containing protein [Treponemataceae bacterium]
MFIRSPEIGVVLLGILCPYSFLVAGGDQSVPFFSEKRLPPSYVIRIVCDDEYPPYCFRSEEGVLQGIIPDHWRAWSQVTGIAVQLEGMAWSQALEEMYRGAADVIDSAFKTPERLRYWDFLAPYADIPVSLYYHKNISGLSSTHDLRGFRVAVKKGDAVIGVLQQSGIRDLQLYPSYESIIRAAVGGDVRIFVMDDPPAHYYLYKYQLEYDFRKGFLISQGQFHRAVQRARKSLPDGRDLYQVLAEGFKAIPSGKYREIEQRWQGVSLGPPINWWILFWIGVVGGALILVLLLFTWTLRIQVARRTTLLIQKNRALLAMQRETLAFIEALPDLFLIVNAEGRYLKIMTSNKDLLFKEPEKLLGKTIDEVGISPEFCAVIKQAIQRSLTTKKVVVLEYDLSVLGGPKHFEARAVRLGEEEKVLFIIRDITEEYQVRQALTFSLREKETLLKEIHHRVKNNMQIISSLLQLQKDSIEDTELRGRIEETQQRIRTMAQVHELLYHSEQLSSIDIADYISKLFTELSMTYYEVAHRVHCTLDLQPAELSIDTAIPLGLIVNELVSNAFKHAYQGRPEGEFRLTFYRKGEGRFCLEVRDDGPGLPENWASQHGQSLGLTLVHALVQQLRGTMAIVNRGGTLIQIIF